MKRREFLRAAASAPLAVAAGGVTAAALAPPQNGATLGELLGPEGVEQLVETNAALGRANAELWRTIQFRCEWRDDWGWYRA